jgi:hypothetical protein
MNEDKKKAWLELAKELDHQSIGFAKGVWQLIVVGLFVALIVWMAGGCPGTTKQPSTSDAPKAQESQQE